VHLPALLPLVGAAPVQQRCIRFSASATSASSSRYAAFCSAGDGFSCVWAFLYLKERDIRPHVSKLSVPLEMDSLVIVEPFFVVRAFFLPEHSCCHRLLD
jgi:hypothetical protein